MDWSRGSRRYVSFQSKEEWSRSGATKPSARSCMSREAEGVYTDEDVFKLMS